MQFLNRHNELVKQEAADIFSDISSIRNPNRMNDMEEFIRTYKEKSQRIKEKQLFHEIK